MATLGLFYALAPHSVGMSTVRGRPPDLVVAALVVMIATAALAAMPPFASICVAVVAAISWCIWLDHNPAS
jgi:hypothetical protein